MTKRVLEITSFVLVCVLLAALETRPADSLPIQIPSTESGNEALKNSELESRLKQQSGENKNSESIQRTTEDEENGDGASDGGQGDGRLAGDPSPEELFAAETGNFGPEQEEEEEEEEEEEKWKDDDEDLEQEPVDDYLDEDHTAYGEENENFQSARNSINESRYETEIQNEADKHGVDDGSEELDEEEERNEELRRGKEEDSENKDYKEFAAPLNMYSRERSQAEYPLERIKKMSEIKTLNRSAGSWRTESDDGDDDDRYDARDYLSASSVM